MTDICEGCNKKLTQIAKSIPVGLPLFRYLPNGGCICGECINYVSPVNELKDKLALVQGELQAFKEITHE